MNVVAYQKRNLAELTTLYNNITQAVPHCYPVEAAELAAAFRGENGAGFEESALSAETVLVAEERGRALGFVHVGEGLLREGGLSGVEGVIRFLAYPRGRRDAGQALLDHAVVWVEERGLPAVTAFPQTYRYPFYAFAHAYVSSYLDNIQALLLMNGFDVSGGEVFLDWLDFDPAPPRVVTGRDFDVDVEQKSSRGRLPDIHVKANQDGEKIGECLLLSASAFSRRGAVEDLAFCQWLGIDEPYQGKGLGAHLLGRALAEAREVGYRHAGISTAFDNHRALLFYSNFGYRAVDWTRRFRRDLARPLEASTQK